MARTLTREYTVIGPARSDRRRHRRPLGRAALPGRGPVRLPRLARHTITCSTTATSRRRRVRPGRAARRSSTASPPRACSTPSRCGGSSTWASRSSPSTPPATAAPRACPPAAATSPPTPSCSAGSSTPSASERAVLAGHSMGGRLVTEYAADQPRAGARRHPHRRHRRADLGPHRLGVPALPAAARRRRRASSCSTRCRRCRCSATATRRPSCCASSRPRSSATSGGRGG